MRRPLVLATTLAAELAVGTLALAPPAAAQPVPEPGGPSPEVLDLDAGPPPVTVTPPAVALPVRTGRAEPIPVGLPDDGPVEEPTPGAAPAVVRSGRGDSAPPDAGGTDPAAGGDDAAPTPEPTTRAPSSRRANGPSSPDATGDTPTDAPPAPTTAPATPPAAPAPDQHVVVAGDHLWAIAAERVASRTGRAAADLSPGDVVTYWVQLCMQNRPGLRSGNPSLVYPGEVLTLPPIG